MKKHTKTCYYNLESLLKDFMDVCDQLKEEFEDSSDCNFNYTIHPSLNYMGGYKLSIYLNFPRDVDKSVRLDIEVGTNIKLKKTLVILSASLEGPPIKEAFDISKEEFKNNIYRTVMRFAL